MATEKTIHLTSGGELDCLFEAANEAPLVLEKDGIRYRLSREVDEVWANYDPDTVLAAIRTAGSTLSREEGEKLKSYMHRAREEGSRPADRP